MSNAWKFPSMVAASLVLSVLFVALEAPWWAVIPFTFALGFYWDRIWDAARAALSRTRKEGQP